MRVALITGASSGLGAEFARQIDLNEDAIDEIWLLARRKTRLEEVAAELGKPTRVLNMDLTDRDEVGKIAKMLCAEQVRVGLLVNCAGYGKIGNSSAVGREDSLKMIDLNCRAVVDVTLTCLPFMQAGDRIIQICSTAAFQPLQQINVYSASKAFLYHYSRALRMELLPRKIAVLAVCSYWIKDTEFIGIANGGEKRETQGVEEKNAPIRSFRLATTSRKVVRSALTASRKGLAVCTPGIVASADRIFAKLLPRTVMIYIWEILRRVG